MKRTTMVGWACVVLFGSMIAGCGESSDAEAGQAAEVNAASPLTCAPLLTCAAPELPKPRARLWRNFVKSTAITLKGPANHRGRDLFLPPDAPQTIIAQFAYGELNVDLVDEEIDVFVQTDCGHGWEKLGTGVTTSSDTLHAPVEGVGDHGGRLYFEIPKDKRLGVGQHRVRLVVAGDGTTTDLLIDVVPPNTPMFVTDVDGTLTITEEEEALKIFKGRTPDAHPFAADALRALVAKGYRPMYLTARPEWLTGRTREFLAERGFPLGVVHTSLDVLGAGFGASAAAFKTAELAELEGRGVTPTWGFGNMTSDADVYRFAVKDPARRVFFKLGGVGDGRSIQSYRELLPELGRLAPACR